MKNNNNKRIKILQIKSLNKYVGGEEEIPDPPEFA